MGEVELKDTYFRRFFVPLIITLLVLCGVAVLLATPPGAPVRWDTFASATPRRMGGALLRKAFR